MSNLTQCSNRLAALPSEQEQLRHYARLDRQLGLTKLEVDDQQRIFQVVADGLEHLLHRAVKRRAGVPANEGATGSWLSLASALARSTPTQRIETQESAAEIAHGILHVLAEPPEVSFDDDVYRACCAVGARIFLAVGEELVRLPQFAARALRNLFHSSAREWADLRSADILDTQALRGWMPPSGATREFKSLLLNLLEKQLPAPPPWVHVEPLVDTFSAGTSIAPASAPERKQPELDDVSANRHMFRDQICRASGTDLLNPNRLELHWERNAVEESKQVLKDCKRHLGTKAAGAGAWKRAVRAALRVLSYQASESIRACFRMPVDGEGDKHFDISDGFIARDWSVAAPRDKSPPGEAMTPDFIGKTYILPEALRVFRALRAKWPSATTIGEMARAEGITLRQVGQALNADWPTSHRPEDARFAWSWGVVLLHLGGHPAVVARITGDIMTVPKIDQWYTRIHDAQIDKLVRRFCEWASFEAPVMAHPYQWRGSKKVLTDSEFRDLVKSVIELVDEAASKINKRSKLEDVIEVHNRYVCAVVLLLEWSIGSRCTKIERRTIESVLASARYALISDKKTDFYGQIRVVPKTSVMRQLLCSYVEHLRSMHQRLHKEKHPAATQIGRVANGELPNHPAFLWIEQSGANNRGYRNVRRKDLVDLFLNAARRCGQQLVADDINRPRHYWYTRLILELVPQLAIDSLLGHHTVGAEPHGYFAGVSVSEVIEYLTPVLARIQGELGFRDLRVSGIGRSYDRYRVEPNCALPRTLAPIPNKYLRRKIREDDLLIRDYYAREQDPPCGTQTLLAHRWTENLMRLYRSRALPTEKMAGCVLFSLVVHDQVLVRSEQEAMFKEVTAGVIWLCGAHVIAEVSANGRPLLQRSLSGHTLLALAALAGWPSVVVSFDVAMGQLHDLLLQLNSKWPARTPAESLSLLSRIASHWCAIEISPGTVFGVFHKAPFIPAQELARIATGGRCLEALNPTSDPPLEHGFGFERVTTVLSRWANATLPGSRKKRRAARTKGCIEDLEKLLNDSRDIFERALIDQLKADMTGVDAYMRNSVTTLAARGSKYQTLYAFFRREHTFELDVDSLREAAYALGANNGINESDVASWVLRHVYHYLGKRGYAVPHGLLAPRGSKRATPPRLPVYMTPTDIEKAAARLDDQFMLYGSASKHASRRLRFERAVGSRDAETKRLLCIDVDTSTRLAHFTTYDRDHLKTAASRGSVRLPEAVNAELAELRSLKIQVSGTDRVPLFSDLDDDRPFERISSAITEACRAVTGCNHFRRHDHRASSVTDICVHLPGGIEELIRAEWKHAVVGPLNATELVDKYLRFHRAARHARHASPLTACRYYNLSFVLDLRRESDIADARQPSGASYAAGLLGCDRQSLYAASDRRKNQSGVRSVAPGLYIERARMRVVAQLRVPELSDALAPEPQSGSAFPGETPIVEGLILVTLGLSVPVAATALRIPAEALRHAHHKLDGFARLLNVQLKPLANLRVFDRAYPDCDATRANVVRSFASALEKKTPTLRGSAALLVASIDRSGQALVAMNLEQFLDLAELIGELLQPEFRAVASISDDDPSARSKAVTVAKRSGIDVESSRRDLKRFAVVHFLEKRRFPKVVDSAVSPRALGIAGRMFVTGLLAAIYV